MHDGDGNDTLRFRRYELKFLLTSVQKEELLRQMEPHTVPDSYGVSVIRSVYYDTETFRLARRSLEPCIYKEKFRLRAYRQLMPEDTAYIELKKKYNGVVYKRRAMYPCREAERCLRMGIPLRYVSHISEEIDYFRRYYATLSPSVYVSYRREGYCGKSNPNFRMTFDDAVCARTDALTLTAPTGGKELLPPDRFILEVKTDGGIPLWLTDILSAMHIYQTGFSKYGTAYKDLIFEGDKGGKIHV